MADSTAYKANTNTTEGSVCTNKADCKTPLSQAQAFAYLRVSRPSLLSSIFSSTEEQKRPESRRILNNYGDRARVIAATYARFYLEIEEHGNIKKKGRYYWMALGAFASKTVACTIDSWHSTAGQVISLSYLPNAADTDFVRRHLALGNFWLFQDIAPFHWYYSRYPEHFDKCVPSRSCKNLHKQVIDNLERMEQGAEVLPQINYLAATPSVIEGFKLVRQIEQETSPRTRAQLQLKHLTFIAVHEQKEILQPLMYENSAFKSWVKLQREGKEMIKDTMLNPLLPDIELVFTHACKTDQKELKSVPPTGTKLEDYDSRMNWIMEAAKAFHNLMETRKTFMEAELKTMAGWHSGND
ncbi:DUF2515 family protein [Chromobacterium sp.]|uniref:DUF2515 family protein n=1 Tax=Chromobacterium sp. TaxID=306190 RepID=UPI0035AECAFA